MDEALLCQQLLEALEADPPDPLEVAGIGGLLGRKGAVPSTAEAWRSTHREAWSRAFHALDLEAFLDRFQEAPAERSLDERLDQLLAFDELCAGTWWMDAASTHGSQRLALEGAVARLVGLMDLHPEAWRDLAPVASDLLQRAAPQPGDPATALWSALARTVR